MTERTLQGFLLTRNWRDTGSGIELEYWFASDEGPVRAIITDQRSVFFLSASARQAASDLLRIEPGVEVKPVSLHSFQGEPVVAVYCPSYRQARRLADSLREHNFEPLEADINPAERFLMERFVLGSAILRGAPKQLKQHLELKNPAVKAGSYRPRLRMVSYDIETAMEGVQLFSIGVHAHSAGDSIRKVFMVGEGAEQEFVQAFANAEAAMTAFLDWLVEFDPDVLIGWNVVNFDTWFLQRLSDQMGLRLTLGRNREVVHWRELDDDGQRRTAQCPGRVLLDGIELLRAAFYRFESFALENVAQQLLGEGKLLHGSGRGEEITQLFSNDKSRLADYNLQDCKLVTEIFERAGLLEFAVARSMMTGLNIDRLGGSVASFDNLYLPQLHRQGYVAPNASRDQTASPGGFVLDSKPGLYDHVLVLDFKSLYPSIILTFCIDPLGLALATGGELSDKDTVPGFIEARFAREGHLLPGLIRQLWQQRDAAKRMRDAPLSQAIKIIMNSFYGVLGSPGCRFFDARLASSITLRGHEILNRTRERIEHMGHRVIYGDTDSVFVWIQNADSDVEAHTAGRELEQDLNQFWSAVIQEEFALTSFLELEFETHFRRFLMPTVRGSEKGSKKRYAGLVMNNGQSQLVFKGLENVRTDWTLVAREFQEELYRRVFLGEPFADYVRESVTEVRSGQRDAQLIYRKRLRRRLDDYQRSIPPHVQAARLCQARGLAVPSRGDWVEYVMTSSGAEPAAQPLAPMDYQYYIDRQLQPVADGILGFVGTSFKALVDKQIDMF
ncbi:MAG: DNA polymerase II [Pseudomonadota bacterium]